ncbi:MULTISPECIES: RsmB/NOP family class I SAM-dependent RNA methyltransferase [unclassified Saccharibacter]|uniref:RsmB/NOP family class I SAM-dependent RNA methyltransferase n=1 Tax=unclassified Saccharibacter TaxID=2648722 RepID=UPI00132B3C84|nr:MULTISPECIES: transcription antitermination factor NusB [unclassified Saccharibacter]MXV35565.1 rRNA cytosine-C5-methylase [Saccharibacter sp. EH611]MXV58890.1 rRNA cytosine-C5-methylase [Saccharibacter sp. EH70]MXV65546.1 rRNA cytosine-C5-methylase [Saccharibacter sp. EH60]
MSTFSSSRSASRPPRPSRRKGGRTPAPRAADPVRDLAFDIVCGVVEHRRMLETTLERSTVKESRDRAAGHRLAAATLRHMGSMSELLGPLLRREPPASVRCALLMGVAQLLHLETPPHAAVGTIVDLLHRRGLAPFAGLANAVLRKVSREGETLREGLDEARLDVPPWLWAAWGRRARAITRGFYREAPLDITVRSSDRIPEGGDVLPTGTVRFPSGTRMVELPGFEDGAFWAQDAAAAMPVRLMGDLHGKQVVDVCAAPGGKTAQLVCAGAQVTAIEREKKRAQRLQENLKRLSLSVDIVVQDGLEWQPKQPVDAVLLDAPCSATGTLRRHPDVLWVKRPRDVKALAEGQDAFIKAAHKMLKPGGTLLYAVCSLQDEEGPQRIAAALEQGGWTLSPFTEEELSALPQARTEEGYYRTHPGMWSERGGLDGFFAARLIKQ